jgi:hypothetical protein
VELTPEERQRIYLEEKARADAVESLKVERDAQRPRGPGVATGILLCLIIIGGACWHNSDATSPSQSTTAARAPVPQTPPLELLASSAYVSDGGGFIIIEGMVRNATSETIRGISAVGEIYTKKDSFISADSAPIEYQPLLPGQRSPFKIMIRFNPAFELYRVGFKDVYGRQVAHENKSK